jgi:endoribonuclease Dicer
MAIEEHISRVRLEEDPGHCDDEMDTTLDGEIDEDLMIDDDDDDDDLPLTGAPSTHAEKRREQKAIFDSWLQTEAAQQPMPRRKNENQPLEEVIDEHLSVNKLIAKQESAEIVKNPREYQLELFERAKNENTIAVLDTGSGKTLIAVLLIRWSIDQELEDQAHGNTPRITFFVVASVSLVFQQHAVLETNLDHKVARFCGAMNTDKYNDVSWKQIFTENRVIVCTADILLQCLSRSYITMRQINLLVFDEAHHTKKNHSYARIIKEYYLAEPEEQARPRVFGMTASPVDAKTDAMQAAHELETLLHSRIATANDLSFQEIVKKKHEQVLEYGPMNQPFETEFLRATIARFSHVKVLQTAFDTVRGIAAELGTWCADQYLVEALAEKKLRKYELVVERAFNECPGGRTIADLDKELAEIRKASEYVRGRWELMPKRIDSKDLSVKVRELQNFLAKEFERPSSYRCLVFVEKRHTARLLAALFQRLELTENLRPGFLTGPGSGNLADVKFSFRQQVVTMMQFRNGEINCLFSTSVAEEGLDVPDCNLVVRFSLYRTMVQYVQSRGRARQNNSKFIHMLERGNAVEQELIRDVRYRELEMKSLCQRLPEDRRINGNQGTLDALMAKEKSLKVYVEPSTGAKLNYGNALVCLANFCSAIPTESDAAEPQHPTYVVTSAGAKFIAEVLLPAGAPMRFAIGEVHSKKSLAKRSAAFEACLELRKKAYLNAQLLPTYAKKLPAMRSAHLAVNMKKLRAYNMKTKPLIWQQNMGVLPEELFVTIVDFPDGLEREHQPIALLTRAPMPQFPSFPIFKNDGQQSRVICYSVAEPLQVNSADNKLSLLTAFTLRTFRDVHSKTYASEPHQMSYWLAPVKGRKGDVPVESILDWELMQEVSEHDVYLWSPEMPDEALADRFIVDKLAGGRKFFSKGVNKDLKPLDPVPEGCARGRFKDSILGYSNSMFKRAREHFRGTCNLNQPVVETEQMLGRRNMLAPPVPKEVNAPTRAPLCLEPLQISVLPTRVAISHFVWPAVIWRLESYLIAIEAADMIGVKCDVAMALAAITKDSESSGDHEKSQEEHVNFQRGMGDNYERLEFMGDCFLKTTTTIATFIQNPNDNEFEFHVRRMVMLCNKNLFTVAQTLKLQEYIRSSTFSRRLWYPEGLRLLEGKGAQKTEEIEEERRVGSTHNLGEKTIADVCEAMIGAAFMSHDQPGRWHPDQWENAVRTVTKLVGSEDHTMLKWDDYREAYKLPAYQTAEANASQLDRAQKVEQEHDYHFRYPRLLCSAFIHPSQPFIFERLPNYQRLEFLGDALLDQTSITYLFNKFPDKDPQWLTEHKMAMISNRALGMIAATTGFYKHIRHCHATVELQIREYVTELREAKNAAPNAIDYWIAVSDPPKCMADVVEAYVGAIFIDSNFDYNEVQRFFDAHIQPHFADMSLYDGYAGNHPCTYLHHLLAQTYGCQQYRIIAKQVPMVNGLDQKGVMLAVMIHNEVFAHDMGNSVRYGRVRVAKMALEKLEGLAPYEFRARFNCECTKADADEVGVRADCAI